MTDQLTIPRPATRSAGAADVPALAETLAAAFHDDPVFRYWIADDAQRREISRAFFGVMVRAGIDAGVVHTTCDLGCGAIWSPPGSEDDEGLGHALAAATGEHAERLFMVLEHMEAQHPTAAHWYLAILGTRPERQGQGLGSAAMRPVLDTCDATGSPAYLEATTARSAELYARHGFEVVGEIRLPDGPSILPMWREPR